MLVYFKKIHCIKKRNKKKKIHCIKISRLILEMELVEKTDKHCEPENKDYINIL